MSDPAPRFFRRDGAARSLRHYRVVGLAIEQHWLDRGVWREVGTGPGTYKADPHWWLITGDTDFHEVPFEDLPAGTPYDVDPVEAARPGPPGVRAALDLARRLHHGQRDKTGAPYFEHPREVARRLTTTNEQIVGLLHDVVEDTPYTLDDLRSEGFEEIVVTAVDALTKRAGESLEASMARVLAEPSGLALRVKRADLSHNADPARLARLDAETRARLLDKYARSAELLGTTVPAVLTEFGVEGAPEPA